MSAEKQGICAELCFYQNFCLTMFFSLMDGVPVKISEQFKPPRKVRLPAGYEQRLLAETTTEEYDFSLEHSVLQKMADWRRLRKVAEEKRKERIKLNGVAPKSVKTSPNKQTQPLAGTSKVHSNSVSPIPNSISPPSSVTTYTNSITQVVSSFSVHNNDSILTPMQIVQPTLEAQTSQISHFNFSDFEADTSSPFDNMELKTINEMEVLAHVLQPLSSSPDTNKNASGFSNCVPGQNSHSENNVDKDNDLPENCFLEYAVYSGTAQNRDNNFPFSRNQVAYDYTSNSSSQKHEFYPNQTWPIRDPGGDNILIDAQNIPIQNLNLTAVSDASQVGYITHKLTHSESIPIKHYSEAHVNTKTHDDRYSNQLINSHFLSMDDSPEYYSPSFPPSNQGSEKSSQSKSVPDIVQELDKELAWKAMDRNRQSPILRPNSYGSAGLENWKPWPNLDTSPERLRPCLKKPLPTAVCGASKLPATSKLPNPFNELSPSARILAKHISEMGFDLGRVARACQAVGPDDKKVVEYLLQVQSLECDKYSGDTAERALVASGFDRTKAVAHLEAMKQLLGLGFKEEEIFDALVRCDNDRDKALDYLIL